jgi:hypothetical protein
MIQNYAINEGENILLHKVVELKIAESEEKARVLKMF